MSTAALLALAVALSSPDWEADVDVRLVSSQGERSVTNGGLGTLRYDDTQSGLRLGRARFAVSEALGEVWSLHFDTSYWGDHDRNPVDLTEAYLQFRPYPFSGGYRFRLKAGAFYAPISLENRSAGWESPYTLSYSAINTWLGQELRTIGAKASSTGSAHVPDMAFDLALTGGVFGWNDPAGVVIANRGFSLERPADNAVRTSRRSHSGPLRPMALFDEIDHHAGFYTGVEARYFDRVVVRALHYDNRGDPAAFDAASRNRRVEYPFQRGRGAGREWQWMDGRSRSTSTERRLSSQPAGTWPGPSRPDSDWFPGTSANHRMSIRYDSFVVDSESGDEEDSAQHGHAWTAAYVFEPDHHWRFTLEWLRVISDAEYRPFYLGIPPRATETRFSWPRALRWGQPPGRLRAPQ